MSRMKSEEFPEGIETATELKALTFSGWLRFVKGLSEEECSNLLKESEKHSELDKEYLDWIKGGKE